MTTSKKDPVIPTVVRELIRESQTIQGWIGRLADHADEAHPEVFERVRLDYSGRLDGVTGHLVKHRSKLVSSLEDRQGTVQSLQADRDSDAADLEEVYLRRAVGELSESQWDSRRANIEATLDGFDSLLAIEEEAVSELTAFVDGIGEGGTPPPDFSLDPEEDVANELDAGGAVNSGAGPEAGKGLAAHGRSWSDLLSGMTDEGDSDASAETATTGEDEAGGEYCDELEFLESLHGSEEFDAVSAMLGDAQGNPTSVPVVVPKTTFGARGKRSRAV